MNYRTLLVGFVFVLSTCGSINAQSFESVIVDHVRELGESGNDIAAFRLLDRLVSISDLQSDELTRMRLEFASKLMYADGRPNFKIDLTMDLDDELTASHPIFVNRDQDLETVKRKLSNAEKLFRDVLRATGNDTPSIKTYPSNQTVSLKTTLRNHIRLISVAHNPALAE